MKEEDNIFRKIGTDNAFKVPEGYFDNLTQDIMSKLPEKESKQPVIREATRWERIKPLLYMAAMFAGAALIIKVATTNFGDDEQSTRIAANEQEMTEQDSERYISEMADGAMIDDYSLYVYLTDNTSSDYHY